jgi:predicted RNase H-like HicB family nuclease
VTPDEHLRVPYTMIIASVRRPDGVWVRRAEYPELPGCVAEAESPLDAIDQLDALRVQTILELLASGGAIPTPRPPLQRLVRAAAPSVDRTLLGDVPA